MVTLKWRVATIKKENGHHKTDYHAQTNRGWSQKNTNMVTLKEVDDLHENEIRSLLDKSIQFKTNNDYK